ncbi:MAG: hypothetical protein JST26_14545 [Bacteroidetes bacterium]|nr:hypothetical protein [Bacteroidota bacterium]
MKPTNITISLFLVLCSFSGLRSQNPVYKEATLSHPAELWNSVKLDADGNNLRNGVLFYKHNEDCGSEKVKLLKLINQNDYAVKVSFQLSAESPVEIVTIPAASSVEGSCSTTDPNLVKLVLKVNPNQTDADKKKNAEFIQSHIFVTRAQ